MRVKNPSEYRKGWKSGAILSLNAISIKNFQMKSYAINISYTKLSLF